MAQDCDACFSLDGRSIVLVSVANDFLDSFPVWVIAKYFIDLINWSYFIAYRRWRQLIIPQEFVQVKWFYYKTS